MIRTREDIERQEDAFLAPYAQRASAGAGRTHAEPQHSYRTDFQRDRARIIHCRAFRRLEGKTQVFLSGAGDHLRTRLTHTIEVASISRAIARALGANEDLAETIALAHDLGHSPLGHTGEKKLNDLMKGEGGFEHNSQSLRIVEVIESKYAGFPGLNLTYEVLEGIRKHDQGYSRPTPGSGGREMEHFPSPSLEAQIANLADEIAYYSHDLDDGLESGLIAAGQLEGLSIWDQASETVRAQDRDLRGDKFWRLLIRNLIDLEVESVVAESARRIEAAGVRSADDVRCCPEPLAGYDDALRKANVELRKFLYQKLYFHPEVAGANRRGAEAIEKVFLACLKEPELMGAQTQLRAGQDGLPRAVCDYVSGMTDRYLLETAGLLDQ